MNMLHRHTEPCTIGAYIHKNKGQKIEMIQQKYVLKSLYTHTHHINTNEKLTKMNTLKYEKRIKVIKS